MTRALKVATSKPLLSVRLLLAGVVLNLMLGPASASTDRTHMSPAKQQFADIVIFGSNIVTVDPEFPDAQGVAVIGEQISTVGTREQVSGLVGENTRVIELGQRSLVPGFIDAHGHLSFASKLIDMVNLSSPPVGLVNTIDDMVMFLRSHIAKKNPSEKQWVIGYGYDDSLIKEGRHPTRDDLDRASDQIPIMLMHVSGHLAAVNSAALTARNVTSETPDPPGGVIRRKAGSQEPNGVMEETAASIFNGAQLSASDPEKQADGIRRAAHHQASYGLTTLQDGGSSSANIAMFRAAAENQPFLQDIVAFPVGNHLEQAVLDEIDFDKHYRGGFRVGGVKFVLDGSPQGRTAYLSEPYTAGPPGADKNYRAYPSYPAAEYDVRIAQLLQKGVPVLAHANGDAAIDVMIDGVAKALEGKPLPDHRTVIIHAQLTREDQLHRIKTLGLIPSYFSAHTFFWGDWHRQSFGEDRAGFISPVGRSAELGIPFTVHNDAPVVPPDVMRLLWATVNRETRSGFILGPDQRATPMQALHAVTLGAAYQYFEEDRKGSITPGKQADLVILGANPITSDPNSIKDIPVLETFSRGRSIYRADGP
ncbi:MAG: amidohydrolase family protein [Gammaproteobacteria bacterium]|nr:amidohydrolase family protein [Gammaproteobacteria bacterium]